MSNTPITFREELARTPDAMRELPLSTYYRYINGIYPKAVDWLMRHPNLLRALAADAEQSQRAATSEN
jgi:hypothetical protein